MKRLEKWLKTFFLFLIRFLLPADKKTGRSADWHLFKKILVFRLDNKFGNSILILSLVQSIRKSLPNAEIDLMMTNSYSNLYLNHPDISSVVPYDQRYLFRNPLRFISLIKKLRRREYDVVFSSSNPDSLSVSQAIFSRLVSMGRTVGFDWKESNKIYSDVVEGDKSVHYAQAQVDLWRYFDKSATFEFPKLHIDQENPIQQSETLLFWLGATGNKFIPESMIMALLKIFNRLQLRPVLAAGPNDHMLINTYSADLQQKIRLIDLSLLELAGYYRKFRIICMPDTGPMHLVAALDIPLIQIFVNSNIIQYGYRDKNKYLIDHQINEKRLVEFVNKFII